MLLSVVLLACGHPAPLTEPKITAIAIDPSDLTVHTGPAGADPVQFVATATYQDGTVGDLDVVEWSVSNRSVGDIDESGLFTPSTTNGGVSWVKAKLGDVDGLSNLTVLWENVIDDEGVDPTPFDGGDVDVTGGLWLYPQDGVNIPRNTPSLTFQWNDVGASAYRLHFQSSVTDVTVYTTQTSWTADQTLWPTIVSTNAGGQVFVDLWADVGGDIVGEPPIAINVNRMDADGAVLYWSTSAQGIKEIPYGGEAFDFLTQAQTGRCIGCHAVNPKKGLVTFTYDGGDGPLGERRVSDGADVIPGDGSAYANFKTYSPDGKYLLGTYHGGLYLWDAETGASLGQVPLDGFLATHVDWSPDGTRVAFTMLDSEYGDWYFAGNGRIATMEAFSDGTFGPPTVVYDPPDPYQAYYPAWSPDGQWIAFDVSTGDGYDDEDAELWVVPGDGGKGIRLDAANRDAALTNSWPRWAPLPDDDVLWLAFGSKRAYGNVSASGLPQIWVAGFDPAKAGKGQDPTWPAFWLPGQDPTQGNHIPVWTDFQ